MTPVVQFKIVIKMIEILQPGHFIQIVHLENNLKIKHFNQSFFFSNASSLLDLHVSASPHVNIRKMPPYLRQKPVHGDL